MSSFERDPTPTAAAPANSSISAKVEDHDDDDHDDAMLHADINKFQTQYPDLQVYPAVDQSSQQHQVGFDVNIYALCYVDTLAQVFLVVACHAFRTATMTRLPNLFNNPIHRRQHQPSQSPMQFGRQAFTHPCSELDLS